MQHTPARLPVYPWTWDIFCAVIDNYGDIGVCWRLATQLAQRGQRVRLWVNAPDDWRWMASSWPTGVEVREWTQPLQAQDLPPSAAHVLVEAFGCQLDEAVQAQWAQARQAGRQGVWINLEYLSAEPYVERCHLLTSPIMQGAAAGLSKTFFYPGFTAPTGGLLREADLQKRMQAFHAQASGASKGIPKGLSARDQWLKQWGVDAQLPVQFLFCYEPAALQDWLRQMAQQAGPVQILVAAGRPQAAVQQALPPRLQAAWQTARQTHGSVQYGTCRLITLPFLTQTEFDHALWASTINFVRGEDSLVRALWAGRPFVWHIYPQHDNAHHAKLHAWLDWMQAPADVRAFHDVWNGIQNTPLPPVNWAAWQQCVQQARAAAWQQTTLVEQLLQHVAGRL